MRRAVTVVAPVLLFFAGLGLPAGSPCRASEVTVWFTVESDGEDSGGTLRVPLEWLVELDRKDNIELNIHGDDLSATDLWARYRNLPPGSSEEVDRGVDSDGDAYVARVVARPGTEQKADGRVHIIAWDERGKKSDFRFPLDLGSVLSTVVEVVGAVVGESTRAAQVKDSLKGTANLTRLADFGPFELADRWEKDGSRVLVRIE